MSRRRDRFVIFVLSAALIVLSTASYYDRHKAPTCNHYRAILDGGKACMKNAGRFRCHMTPERFVDYYDAKYYLEAYCPGPVD